MRYLALSLATASILACSALRTSRSSPPDKTGAASPQSPPADPEQPPAASNSPAQGPAGGDSSVKTPSTTPASTHPEVSATNFQNPLIDLDFPDPSVLQAADGWFYVYATQGSGGHIQVAKSQDLAHWQRLPNALPQKPAWADQTQSFWAPDVKLHNGVYYMYFSSAHNGRDGMCIGVATAHQPSGPFIPTATPLVCGPSFVHIDPMAFDDPATGKHLLYWGSGFEPLKVQELSDDRLSFAAGTSVRSVIDQSAFHLGLLEGAWMTLKDGTYYLFASGDDCCGSPANNYTPHYLVVVARSTTAFGPFTPAPQPVIQSSERWLGPGHNAVIRDRSGTDWLLYHAVDSYNRLESGHIRRPLLMDKLSYVDGWPVVSSGRPSDWPQVGPVLGP